MTLFRPPSRSTRWSSACESDLRARLPRPARAKPRFFTSFRPRASVKLVRRFSRCVLEAILTDLKWLQELPSKQNEPILDPSKIQTAPVVSSGCKSLSSNSKLSTTSCFIIIYIIIIIIILIIIIIIITILILSSSQAGCLSKSYAMDDSIDT